MTLGERIKFLRNNKNISQEVLANHLNISRQALQKWESDKSEPSIDSLLDLAKYFDVSIEYLLTENNTSNTESSTNKNKKYSLREIISFSCLITSFLLIIGLLLYAIFVPRMKDGLINSANWLAPVFPLEISELIFLILLIIGILGLITSLFFLFFDINKLKFKRKKDETKD